VLILALYPLPIAMASMRKHNAVLAIIVTNLWLGLDRNRLDRGPDLGLQLECGSGRRMSVLLLLGRERRWRCHPASSILAVLASNSSRR
jgi:hypothetical protein